MTSGTAFAIVALYALGLSVATWALADLASFLRRQLRRHLASRFQQKD